MALNINTSRLNDSIQRMLSFYMQNKLSEMSQARQMESYAEEDRLMRERAAEADVRSRGLKEYGNKLDLTDYFQKGFFDTAIKNDAFTAKIRAAQGAEMIGDIAKAKQDRATAFEMAVPAIMGNFEAFKGKVSPESLAAGVEAFGESGMEKMMDKAVQQNISMRGAATAKRGQDIAMRGQDITVRGQNIDISKLNAEQGGPGIMGDKQRKEYIDTIDKTTSFLVDQGVRGEAMNSGIRALFDSGKVYDPMSKENRGKALTYMQEIKMQIIQGKPPSPTQQGFLTKMWNVPAVEAGGLPSPQTGLTTTETVAAETQINQNMLSMITNQIMQKLGLAEDKRDYATQLAREFLAGLK